ncbi:MAG: tail fiber domain-containing protein [Bacteroidota bacterium]
MNTTRHFLLSTLLILVFSHSTIAQVAINQDGSEPDSSAILDLSSSDRGLLVPRMSSTARLAIENPAEGLMVFDSTDNRFWFYHTEWKPVDNDLQTLAFDHNLLSINNGNEVDLANLRHIGPEGLILSQDGIPELDVNEVDAIWTNIIFVEDTWQSFTATKSGDLTRVVLNIASPDTFQDGHFQVYKGEGIGGTLLISFPVQSLNNGWNEFDLPADAVPVYQDSVYTFSLIDDDGAFSVRIRWVNTYTGGRVKHSPIQDLRFQTFVTPTDYIPLISFNEVDEEQANFSMQFLDTLFFTDGSYQVTGLPDNNGIGNLVLTTDNDGVPAWELLDIISLQDDLGNHTATQNIQLSNWWLSNDGDNEGISIDDLGKVRISSSQNGVALDVDGDILLSHAATEMGLTSELANTTPILNLSLNALTPNIDPNRLGGLFRIDSRTVGNNPLFQWIQKPVGTTVPTNSDLLMSLDATTGLAVNGSVSASAFTGDGSALTNVPTDNLGNHTATQNISLTGKYVSNDGGNEGLSIDNDGIVNTSNHLGIGGHVTAQNYIGIGNNGQSLTLAADEPNNRIILDVGGSGHSGDAIVFGELGTGSQNPVLMQGNLAVGTLSPPANYKLVVNGQPAANGFTFFTNYSDRRLKHSIQPIGSTLDRITQLRPVSFRYKETTGYDSTALATTFRGFIAQELQAIFPEMVGDVQLNGETYLDANLSSLPVYLVKAMQEQQALIYALTEVNQAQKVKLQQQQEEIDSLKNQVARIDELEAMLQQLQVIDLKVISIPLSSK